MHAHPDDETINNGATIAHYTARGAEVTVLTCTLGEEVKSSATGGPGWPSTRPINSAATGSAN